MGLFDSLGQYQSAGLLGAIRPGDFYDTGPDEAEAARLAAALRMQRSVMRQPAPLQGGDVYSPFGFQTGGMGDLASILSQPSAMPPIAPQQQPQAIPQDAMTPIVPQDVPLPRPRPDMEVPQNAQPATGFAPQMVARRPFEQLPVEPAPGGLRAGFEGFINNAHTGPLGALLGGIGSAMGMDGGNNVTVRALMARGIDRETAKAAAVNPEIMKAVMGQAFGERKPAGVFKFGNVEIPYTLNQDGSARVILPNGQAGTLNDFIKFGQNVEAEGKGLNAQAEKAGQVKGESAATAEIDLPSAVASAKEQLRLIEELRNHPGRNQVGWHDYFGQAPLIPSTRGFDANRILDQIKGGSFLEAFKALKGGGQITEVEGKKATDAITRMDRAQSKGEFDKALSDYEGIIKLGIDRANQKAGQPAPYGFKGNSEWRTAPNGVRIRQVQ